MMGFGSRLGRGWMDEAACVDHPDADALLDDDVFVQAWGISRVCRGCPVRAECLDYALAARIDTGVWGGMTEKQRRGLDVKAAGWN